MEALTEYVYKRIYVLRKDRLKEDNMEEYYLICEDSLEGIFTGVYDAYLWK